jgi:hypothetical protein
MNTQERVKEINLRVMTDLKAHNSAMMTGFVSIMIFSIFAIASFAAIWYRLDAIKANVGL